MVFQFYDCSTTAVATIGFSRVAFSFRQRKMTKGGHDVVSARASIRKESPKGFAKAMWTAIGWETRFSHRVAHPPTEPINGDPWERLRAGVFATV